MNGEQIKKLADLVATGNLDEIVKLVDEWIDDSYNTGYESGVESMES